MARERQAARGLRGGNPLRPASVRARGRHAAPSVALEAQEGAALEDDEPVSPAMSGSTDVGDISWLVPTAGLSTATWVPGTAAHSWQAVATGGTGIGAKGMLVAAKTLALTAIELYGRPALIREAWEELERRRGPGFEYTSLVGDREPPLDYRR